MKLRPTERVLMALTIILAVLALGADLRVARLSPLSNRRLEVIRDSGRE